MRNVTEKIGLTVVGICIVLFAFNCAGDVGNEYLGKLPSMAANYFDEYDRIMEEMEASTERDPSLGTEFNMLRPNADAAIEEYLENNSLRNLPFEQETNDPFNVEEIWVESATTYQFTIKARVILTEETAGMLLAYVKAVDKEGHELGRSLGMLIYQGSDINGANTEIELSGSIGDLAALGEFDKLIFISSEEMNSLSTQ